MRRPWHAWVAFFLCSVGLAGTLAWTSRKALLLDRSEAEARAQAALEENSRLALWRMDSQMTALIVRESAQPASTYAAFLPAPDTDDNRKKGRRVIPSPLLLERSPYVRLHVEFDPAGHVRSPQVPEAAERKLAIPQFLEPDAAGKMEALLREMRGLIVPAELAAQLPESGPAEAVASIAVNEAPEQPQQAASLSQTVRNYTEFAARTQLLNAAQSQNTIPANPQPKPETSSLAADRTMGPMTALWVKGELLLARKSIADGRLTLQACWLDWPALRHDLLASVSDLLPAANLVPVSGAGAAEQSRLLATLPVRLESASSLPPEGGAGLSPLRVALLVAWATLACVIVASGFLLRGVVALNERRAAFVSAVTHELRTPLTTFRLYSEMLAEDMLPNESDRKRYLQTLRTEADRLFHLVENVLAYARLERGGSAGRLRELTIDELLSGVRARLDDRAKQGAMTLHLEAGAASADRVLTDPGAVEQILFNLVDNACKYGVSPAGIRISAARRGKRIELAVRDEGPGMSPAVRRRLFQPFQKSASDAAQSAPGVGLGLALCRRLAREIGGDLRLDSSPQGTCFVIDLPSTG